MNRRSFIKTSAVAGGSVLLVKPAAITAAEAGGTTTALATLPSAAPTNGLRLPALGPAEWVWYPSARCLANTFVLFRRELNLRAKPLRATG